MPIKLFDIVRSDQLLYVETVHVEQLDLQRVELVQGVLEIPDRASFEFHVRNEVSPGFPELSCISLACRNEEVLVGDFGTRKISRIQFVFSLLLHAHLQRHRG